MRHISSLGFQVYFIGLFFMLALICLLTTTAYILYQTNLESQHKLSIKAEIIHKHIQLQLLQIESGYTTKQHFPNLRLISDKQNNKEGCIQYTATDKSTLRNACYGGLASSNNRPDWFKSIYHWAFHPTNELVKLIIFNNQTYGELVLTPDVNKELNHAWNNIKELTSFFSVLLSLLCIVLYFFLNRGLKPVDAIVSNLENMTDGNLSSRLPEFKILEWQRTAKTINQLSDTLESSLNERNLRTIKLIQMYEEDRWLFTRDLHDVFGQHLTEFQSITLSLIQTAKEKCHELVEDCQNIAAINSLMIEHLRQLFLNLHASTINEQGLISSLKSLVSNWNSRSDRKIRYSINLDTNTDQLPEAISNHIFHIIQECLSNNIKNSEAKNSMIKLEILSSLNIGTSTHSSDTIYLTISDDGVVNNINFETSNVAGLIGVRERVTALGGKISLSNSLQSGLHLQIWLPVQY